MNIVFDGNYLYHVTWAVFCKYHRDEDLTEVLSKKENQQVLMRKLIIDMCFAINKFRDVEKVVVVFDRKSWRYNLHEDYKYALTKVQNKDHKVFEDGLDAFEKFLRKKKLIVSRITGAEGDDLIYGYAEYYGNIEKVPTVIVTADSDIRQLVTDRVSVFCNAAKSLRYFKTAKTKLEPEKIFADRTGVEIETIDPLKIVLKKIFLGDKSDNIPSIKRGFGEKAFDKFYDTLGTEIRDCDFDFMCSYLCSKFVSLTSSTEEYYETLKRIRFNAKMVWLNYEALQYSGIAEQIFDEIEKQRDTYDYHKGFTLEDFYGMLIK